MNRKRISEISAREILIIVIPTLLIGLLVFGVAYHYVMPAPPRTLVMTTGMAGGSSEDFGEQYRRFLARDKVHLDLRPSEGSVENLKRLMDRSTGGDVGFIMGGSGSVAQKNLVSLGAICYMPFWVFYRSDQTYDDLSQLKGKRISIGPEGSSVRKFALDMLKASRAAAPPTVLLDLTITDGVKALKDGKVDAVIIFSTADNAVVQNLLYAPGIKLMNFSQAEAYSRLFPALSHVILPKGILDLEKKIPSSDIHLLSPTVNLIARDNLHPAFIYLLLEAAVEIHGSSGWLQRAGEFPSPKPQDIPLSDEAMRFYKSDRPFLLSYLPFWGAVYAERAIRIVLPVALVVLPLLRIIPWLYTRRNRSKFYHWYGELKYLESEVTDNQQPERIPDYRTRLDQIEYAVNKVNVPMAFYNEIYTLREHIDFVRGKISRLIQDSQGVL
jgi:TRAP-type uncharacterized transport system substrate-binding protein